MATDELLRFKRNALRLGLCDRYKGMWDDAVTREGLMDIALDANGVSFVCESVSVGWGATPEYILRSFGAYVNGAYVRDKDGYTSEMYVCHAGDRTPLRCCCTVLVSCSGVYKVASRALSCIYVCGDSDVVLDIPAGSRCAAHVYAGASVRIADGSAGSLDCIYEENKFTKR